MQGLTSVAVLSLAERDAEVVSWLIYREEDVSNGVSFALELAASINSGLNVAPKLAEQR